MFLIWTEGPGEAFALQSNLFAKVKVYCLEHALLVSLQFQSMYIPLGQGTRENKYRRKQWSPTKFPKAKGLCSLDKVTKCSKFWAKQCTASLTSKFPSTKKNLRFFVQQMFKILFAKIKFSPCGVKMSIENPFVVANHVLNTSRRTKCNSWKSTAYRCHSNAA